MQVVHESLPSEVENGAWEVLPGEISGARTRYHTLVPGQARTVMAVPGKLYVLFLIGGSVAMECAGQRYRLDERACLVAPPGQGVDMTARAPAALLEIKIDITPEDEAAMATSDIGYPYLQRYASSERYRDASKSAKTVSRRVVPPGVVPRFCMGSVETDGPDRVEPHAHPMLDQLFFTFPEHGIQLLVDGVRFTLPESTLMHIPLGSLHGAEVAEGQGLHYLWMDFFFSQKDMAFISRTHRLLDKQ